MKNKSINEEAGLGPEWREVDSAPIIPGRSPVSFPINPLGNYIVGSISPSLQHDANFIKTAYGTPMVPIFPLMPVAGSPSSNASTQTVVRASSSTFVSTGAGGSDGDVQINSNGALYGDSGFSYDKNTQDVTVGGNLNIGGSLVITGGILITGNLSVTGYIDTTTGFRIGGVAASGKYLRGNGSNFVSATLSGADVLTGLVGVTYGGTGSNLSATGGTSQVLKQTGVGSAVTVGQLGFSDLTGTISLAQTVLTTLGDILYVNASPALARLAGNITSSKNFLTQTGTGAISAVPVWGTLSSGDIPNLPASIITSGQLALARGGTNSDLSATGGSNQILKQSTVGGAISVSILASGDIPNLPASIITSGQLVLARGGTNADLSATGGASQVLRQSSGGAAITVSQLAASDLSNGTTGTTSVVLSSAPTVTTPKWTAYAVASLPAGSEGQYAYASDGRKVGEGGGAGTGVPVYFSNSQWRVFSTDLQVLA